MSLRELLDLRRSFGILFQEGALWGSMNVFDNVALPLRQHTDLREPVRCGRARVRVEAGERSGMTKLTAPAEHSHRVD